MPRKELKNIAQGILSSFISRNNDVFGYWGIGKLYSLMLKNNNITIEIDLIKKIITHKDTEFKFMINYFSGKLFQQLKIKNLEKNIKKAIIELQGFPDIKNNFALNKMQCTIKIIDDLEKTHQFSKNVWCRKHNPKRESKSTRIYK